MTTDCIEGYQEAHRRDPKCVKTLDGLARALVDSHRYNEAAEVLRQRLRLEPESADTHASLAELYSAFGHCQAALKHRQTGVRLRPDDAESLAWLSVAQWHASDLAGCLVTSRRLIDEGRAPFDLHSFSLSALLHRFGETPGSLRRAHEEWAQMHAPSAHYSPRHGRAAVGEVRHRNSPIPDRRLRIGYLGGEFLSGPAFHFLIPILRHHDRTRFDVFCYHTRPDTDECTRQFAAAISGGWRDASRLSSRQIFDSIQADEIDVLVDISGQYPNHGLRVFAARPAPVQVTFPNYPSTTGVGAIDFLLTDRWTCPIGFESQYTEQAWMLPSGYLVYEPPSCVPEIPSESPAMRNGFVTFGMFQRPAKTNEAFWKAAALVLEKRPSSRLLIHNSDRELESGSSGARRFFLRHLLSRGVEPARVSFRDGMPLAEHLACVGDVDIALDTFPYNGQTTTCECLWMGVPVVTLAGEAHVARVGSAILERVGLPELVAETVAEYVDIAVKLSEDLPGLSQMRCEGLRTRMRTSTLIDGRTVTNEIEAAYRQMWRQWCLEETKQ